ncbi:hypothetical protein HDE_00862 [Halotydeus destructor]|nr:hypothetical protein HDE_00862 [Halotydeus destructor]
MHGFSETKLKTLNDLVNLYFYEEIQVKTSSNKYFVTRVSHLVTCGTPTVMRVDDDLENARHRAMVDVLKLAILIGISRHTGGNLINSLQILASSEKDRLVPEERK